MKTDVRVVTRKTPEDFAKMAVAGACVAAIHAATREAAQPGTSTRELDAISAAILRERGCRSSFLGYRGLSTAINFPATICASPNEVIVHGIPGDYRLRDGDIISIDAGAIYEGWHGDAAFTVAVGDVPAEVTQLLEVTERSLWNGIAPSAARRPPRRYRVCSRRDRPAVWIRSGPWLHRSRYRPSDA